MPNLKIERTFHMDGLLDGPIFSDDDESLISAFVENAGPAGLKFHKAIDAARFSILADTQPVELSPNAEPAHTTVVKCLNELLKNYSPEECMQLTSTLRSVEYIPGHEIQTLYGIRPDGTASVEQRTVRAETIRPAPPLPWRSKLKLIALVILMVGAALGVSTFFVPYRDITARLIDRAKPFKLKNLEIDAVAYRQFFLPATTELNKRKSLILIVCKTSRIYPTNDDQLNELWKASADSTREHLAIEALARNCLRCEFFDRDGNFRGQQLCYIRWTSDRRESFTIAIPFNRYLSRVRITY